MTEEEASKRWCPFVRQACPTRYTDGDVRVEVINRYDTGRPLGNCLGSECMQWRWHKDEEDRVFRQRNDSPEPMQGYCGLAGVPLP